MDLGDLGAVPHGGEGRLNRVGRVRWIQCSHGEVVERQQLGLLTVIFAAALGYLAP